VILPTINEYPTIGSQLLGYISVAQLGEKVPFEIKRVYWTYFTPNNVQRGGHAHKKLQQIIFAVSGTIEFNMKGPDHYKEKIILDKPNIGLYIPKLIWREIKFSHSAVLLCLASELYDESDYIRDYNTYLEYLK